MLICKYSVVPLAFWPVGPKGLGLGAWPVGPWVRWSSALGLGPLGLGPCARAFGLSLLYLWTTKHVDHFPFNPSVWLATKGAKLPCMWDFRVVKARSWIRRFFFGTWWFEDTTPMSIADVVLVALSVYAENA